MDFEYIIALINNNRRCADFFVAFQGKVASSLSSDLFVQLDFEPITEGKGFLSYLLTFQLFSHPKSGCNKRVFSLVLQIINDFSKGDL